MGNKEKNFVSAVVYVHNAEKTIGRLLDAVINVLEENFEHSEVICVNDDSLDDSVIAVKESCRHAASSSVSLVNLSRYHGLEMAMNAGVDLSIGDYVFEFDCAVLDFPREEIMSIYRRSLEGYDVVSAVPNRTERPTSRLFYDIFNKFAYQPCEMRTESFRILSRRVINRIGSMNRTVPYRKAIYAAQGLKTDTLEYEPIGSGIGRLDGQERRYRCGLAVDSLILFTEIGYRFSVAMTAVMMLMSILIGVYSIVVFVTQSPVAGWTTTILFLSLAFFGLFGILTIIIKYLQLLVNLVFKRKQYSFESIEKLTE